MPPSGCGVHKQLNLQLSTRILVYFQNAFLRTRFFLAYRANHSLWPTRILYLCRWVALRSKQTDGVHMNRLAYPLPEAARIADSYTRPRVSYRLLQTDKREHVNER
jgi:hypothetical protein